MSEPRTPYTAAGKPGRSERRRSALGAALCATALAICAFAVPSSAAEPEIPPVVIANPAVPVSGGYALKGTIYTYALDTHYHFEYGTSTAYGASVPIPDADAGVEPVVTVSETVTGLAPNTTYHYRIVAVNSKGPGTSGDQAFTTSADPTVTPPPTATPPPAQSEGEAGKGKQLKLKTVKVKGRSTLATSTGRTLYSLSVEKNGKFICTKASGCLALWHPLLLPKGATPVAPVKVGTIKRPDGGTQVTFHGRPLYTYAADTKPGLALGEGAKDVGTWHSVKVASGR
jgi:predicted lipoprotein with Yx(FWY)xxD motif